MMYEDKIIEISLMDEPERTHKGLMELVSVIHEIYTMEDRARRWAARDRRLAKLEKNKEIKQI